MSLSLSLGLWGGGRGAAAVAPYVGFIATGCGFGRSTSSSSNQVINSWTEHVAISDMTDVMIAPYCPVNITTGTEVGNGSSVNVRISVEYPIGGGAQFKQLTFPAPVQVGGDPNIGHIPAAGLIFTDLVSLGFTIPAGSSFRVRQELTGQAESGTTNFYLGWQTTNSRLRSGTTLAAAGGDVLLSGSLTSNVANRLIPPAAIIGTTTKPSILISGDSKTFGSTDTVSAAVNFHVGMIARGMPQSTYAFVNIASPGRQASDFISTAPSRWLLAPYASHHVVDLGYNDMMTNSQSAATTQTRMETFLTAVDTARPGAKKTITTITPRGGTTSDSWATTAGQTVHANNPKRVTYNAAVRAASISGVNNGYFEISDLFEATSRDSGLWIVNGSANGYTADGVHPTPAAFALIDPALIIDHATKFTYP